MLAPSSVLNHHDLASVATKDDGFLASGSVHLPESNVAVNGTTSSSFHSAELTRKMGSTEQRSSNHSNSEHPRKSTGADLATSRSGSAAQAPSNSSGSSSHRSSSHGGRSSYPSSSSQQSQSSSSNAHRNSTGSSGTATSSSNSMPRRNSSNALSGSGSSSRDRDGRDRDSRDRDSRDRDSRSYRNHSRSRDKGNSSSNHSASGTPAMRLRERNNILLMHRTGARRTNLSSAEIATRVIGMDASYMKVRVLVVSIHLCRNGRTQFNDVLCSWLLKGP